MVLHTKWKIAGWLYHTGKLSRIRLVPKMFKSYIVPSILNESGGRYVNAYVCTDRLPNNSNANLFLVILESVS